MDKKYEKIYKSIERKVLKIKQDIADLLAYTEDDFPMLTRDGDFYVVTDIKISEGAVLTYKINYNDFISDEDFGMIIYEDGEYYPNEYLLDQLKEFAKDIARGKKDFRTFNPEIHENPDGERSDKYMNSLGESLKVCVSIEEYFKL